MRMRGFSWMNGWGIGTQATAECEARCWWISATTAAPSPIAPPTRLTEPERTSPTAKTPGTLVSSAVAGRAGKPALASEPVCTKPCLSTATPQPASQSVGLGFGADEQEDVARGAVVLGAGAVAAPGGAGEARAVSYTHLTLPTSDLV